MKLENGFVWISHGHLKNIFSPYFKNINEKENRKEMQAKSSFKI